MHRDKFRDQALFLDNTFPRRSRSIGSGIKPTILKIRITLRIATFLVIKAITSLDEGNVNLTFALQRFAVSLRISHKLGFEWLFCWNTFLFSILGYDELVGIFPAVFH